MEQLQFTTQEVSFFVKIHAQQPMIPLLKNFYHKYLQIIAYAHINIFLESISHVFYMFEMIFSCKNHTTNYISGIISIKPLSFITIWNFILNNCQRTTTTSERKTPTF